MVECFVFNNFLLFKFVDVDVVVECLFDIEGEGFFFVLVFIVIDFEFDSFELVIINGDLFFLGNDIELEFGGGLFEV